VAIITTCLFTAFSFGTATAPNLASYFVFRCLTASQGTGFLVIGSSCIGDVYRPTERATAIGWFMFATTVGPAFGPLWGSVIITFTSWRVMFWLQAGLAGLSAILVILFLPETIHHKLLDDIRDKPSSERTRQVLHQLNPLKIVKMIRYPNLLLTVRVSQGI